MAPITRQSTTKVTSTVKYNSLSSENSVASKNAVYLKRKAEHSPPKHISLKRALHDVTNDKTAQIKSVVKNENELLVSPEKRKNSTVVKTKVKYPVTGLRLPCSSKGVATGIVPKNRNVTSTDAAKKVQVPTSAFQNVGNQQDRKAGNTRISTVNVNKFRCAGSGIRLPCAQKETRLKTVFKECEPKKSVVTILKTDHQPKKCIRVTRSSFRLKENVSKPHNSVTSSTFQGMYTSEQDVEVTRSSARLVDDNRKVYLASTSNGSTISQKLTLVDEKEAVKVTRRSSARLFNFRKSLTADKSIENNSLYVSALEDIFNNKTSNSIPTELSEFDKELLHDPHQVSLYAMEIFEYLKSREAHFAVSDYMRRHKNKISEEMRAVLVDWMVEVQENFELNHETLYLAVKLVDIYLDRAENIEKDMLQLIAVTALFVSCKYDERLSPLLEDYVYVCDGAYKQQDILAMEQNLLKIINFELSPPISYSFLRRYARCARVQMPLLTLARYILELSLMDYRTVTLSDSKLAAASLYLSFRMVKHDNWTESLIYYTGYNLDDFKDIVFMINSIVHKRFSEKLQAIKTKYSHDIFFKVAQTPLISDEELRRHVARNS